MIAHTIYKHKESTEWVTFIHGAGGSSTIWFKQIRAFQAHFNVLLIDLRGHGASKNIFKQAVSKKYTFATIADDVLEVLQHLQIPKSHFVGISLGTIVIRQLAETHPELVKTMSLGGAIMKMNFRSQILMKLGNIFKYVLPYLVLYRFFAFIIMPKKNHKKSRLLFINEAKKLYQKEFIRWFKLTAEINPLLRWFRQVELEIPTLYIMGEEDYMFLPTIRKIVQKHAKASQLFVVTNCGHVVNVEQPLIFNEVVVGFIQKNA
ncbi:MAG: alpha/beta fold hydrolase [Flavobacterium sp.]